jgi:predicted NUDIX family NTP pyrophosphohydrolase
MNVISAGILLYRYVGHLEVFLAHSTNHKNIYSFPRGEIDPDESIFNCALREFEEETDFRPPSKHRKDYEYIGCVRQNKEKSIHAFAIEADIDHEACTSNWCEYPTGTGKWIPEIDDYRWVHINEAYQIINPRQIPLLKRLQIISRLPK